MTAGTEDTVLEHMDSWAERLGLREKKGVIYKGNHRQDGQKLYREYIAEFSVTLPQFQPPSAQDFQVCLAGLLTKPEEDPVNVDFKIPTVSGVASFVPLSLERKNIKISPLGDEITDSHGKNLTLGDLEVLLVCEAHEYNEESRVGGKLVRTPITIGAVKDFIRKEIHDKAGLHWVKKREELTHDRSCENYADICLKGIIKAFNFQGDPELNLAVLKQWIWQTKRYFLNRIVADPLMVNIYSAKGGGGKTQIIRKLSEPLEEYTASSTLNTILDSREHGLFTDRFIVFFDELSLGKIEHGQIGPLMAGLKKIITEDKITQRNMRETSHSKKRRVFSPVSTSNQPIAQMLPDDSGMRRFFEIEMKAEPNISRIKKLRAIAAHLIWQGIDENLEHGYIVHGNSLHDKLLEHQANLKHRSILDDCLENIEELPILENSVKGREVSEIISKENSLSTAQAKIESLGLSVVKVYEYRRSLRDWTAENMDQYLAKFLPGIAKLPTDLENRGFYVLRMNRKTVRIVLEEPDTGGAYV